MFGISGTEMVMICALALLLFGGKKIPELARGLGRGISEFKKGARELENEAASVEQEGKAAMAAALQAPEASAKPAKATAS